MDDKHITPERVAGERFIHFLEEREAARRMFEEGGGQAEKSMTPREKMFVFRQILENPCTMVELRGAIDISERGVHRYRRQLEKAGVKVFTFKQEGVLH